ncbi:hypothetical protein AGMMS49949_02690 [Alphaproteobacteria bacterium]|nr:hypothetical protein AGMMS49949_02690 [Alphaproteobacteria bacterium]GHS96021.1 hypothetical protein AGMMS50296_1700 [Alphaproteobacteria bacterium]
MKTFLKVAACAAVLVGTPCMGSTYRTYTYAIDANGSTFTTEQGFVDDIAATRRVIAAVGHQDCVACTYNGRKDILVERGGKLLSTREHVGLVPKLVRGWQTTLIASKKRTATEDVASAVENIAKLVLTAIDSLKPGPLDPADTELPQPLSTLLNYLTAFALVVELRNDNWDGTL